MILNANISSGIFENEEEAGKVAMEMAKQYGKKENNKVGGKMI